MEELKDIQLSSEGTQSLQSQLYQAIRSRIINGRYQAGLKLPASRLLAVELGVSRNTVLMALEHLRAEGYVEARRGAGTFVTEAIPDHFCQPHVEKKPLLKSKNFIEKNNGWISPNSFFAPGVPDLNAFPLGIWKKIQKNHSGRTALMGYDSSQGYTPLREALAHYLRTSRACDCDARQIIITDGAQQALSLAAQVLLRGGETVYVENPGYVRARKVFQARACRVQGIDVDEQGIIPGLLPKSAQGKLLSLTPTHQFPMGGVLSLSRRMEVLSWLKQNKVWLLEDDYDSEFHFYQKPVAAMQSLGLANQVIYMGSFSKVIFPALRLGYLLVPEGLVDEFVTTKHHMSGESNLFEQAVTAEFLNEGHFNRHILRMRKLYEMKLSLLLEECEKVPGIRVITPAAGMHIVLLFEHSAPAYDADFSDRMRQQGVNANPLSSYYLNELLGSSVQQGLVLGFANASNVQIVQGIRLIGKLLKGMMAPN